MEISKIDNYIVFVENGETVATFSRNKAVIKKDKIDTNIIYIIDSTNSTYKFNFADVTSPIVANSEALIEVLQGYLYSSSSGVDYESSIAQGLFDGYNIVLKSGRNPNITSASLPEDMISESSPYVGFPTSAPEELQFLSNNAGDTGIITFTYLPTATSTAYLVGTVTLNGTTPVNSGVTAYRVHTMNYNSGSATAFNLGIITCRWRTTTSVIFLTISVGTSQSYSAVYTVPFGSVGYVKRVFCEVHDNSSVSIQGALWIRAVGTSPRLRRNFASQTGSSFNDEIYGGLELAGQTDITMRITNSSSASATMVVGGFDLLIINENN